MVYKIPDELYKLWKSIDPSEFGATTGGSIVVPIGYFVLGSFIGKIGSMIKIPDKYKIFKIRFDKTVDKISSDSFVIEYILC